MPALPIWREKQEKAHELRPNLARATRECSEGASVVHTGCCATCLPVLSLLMPAFISLVRQGAELRHSKRVLPHPKKSDKQHYRNLGTKCFMWIRANLFDALGNYKYCSACIIHTLDIGSQRLVHQRSIKQREALTPLVHVSKSEIVNDRLENFVVMPEGKYWSGQGALSTWATWFVTKAFKLRKTLCQGGFSKLCGWK
jgi:hypothetical protein